MNEYQQYVDSLILKALREDDENAISHLFKFYYNKLFRAGLRWCADQYITEESIQDVFMDFWVYRHSIENITTLENYLKISLRRRVFKKLKKINPLVFQSEFEIENTPSIFSSESYEAVLIHKENNESLKKLLEESMQKLTPKQKEIIHLKYFEEKSYKEISEATGMEIGTLYKLLHDAIKKLKLFLETT